MTPAERRKADQAAARRRVARKIIRLHREQPELSKAAIARHFGIDRATVSAVLVGERKEVRSRVRRADYDDIRRLYREGITKAAISRQLRVAYATVSRALGYRMPVSAELRALILALHRQGTRNSEIVKRLGVNPQLVSDVVNDAKHGPPILVRAENHGVERAAGILRLVDQHPELSHQQIARRMRCEEAAIGRLIKIRAVGGVPRLRERLAPPEIAAARQGRIAAVAVLRRSSVLPMAEIARRLTVMHKTVRGDLFEAPISVPFVATGQVAPQIRRLSRGKLPLDVPHAEVVAMLGIPVSERSLRQLHRVPPALLKMLKLLQDAEIRRLVARGTSKKEIAKRLDLPLWRPYWTTNAPPQSLPVILAPRIKALVEVQGVAAKRVARDLGVSGQTVAKALALDIAAAPDEPLHPQRRLALRVLALHEAGAGITEIGRRLGLYRNQVRELIARAATGEPIVARKNGKGDFAAIVRLGKRRLTNVAIARRLDLDVSTVQLYRQIRSLPPTAPDLVAEIQARAAVGQRRWTIARELRIDPRIVYGIVPASALVQRRPNPPSLFISLAQMAAELEVDLEILAAAISAGQIPGVIRLGQRQLIPRRILRQLLTGSLALSC
jgi:DNA-binding CsgD family transcriptional regulator/DNA-binding transcriptional regulator LsrR (DeoR family)